MDRCREVDGSVWGSFAACNRTGRNVYDDAHEAASNGLVALKEVVCCCSTTSKHCSTQHHQKGVVRVAPFEGSWCRRKFDAKFRRPWRVRIIAFWNWRRRTDA